MGILNDSIGIGSIILTVPVSVLAYFQFKTSKKEDRAAELAKVVKEIVVETLAHSRYQTTQLIPKNGKTFATDVTERLDEAVEGTKGVGRMLWRHSRVSHGGDIFDGSHDEHLPPFLR